MQLSIIIVNRNVLSHIYIGEDEHETRRILEQCSCHAAMFSETICIKLVQLSIIIVNRDILSDIYFGEDEHETSRILAQC